MKKNCYSCINWEVNIFHKNMGRCKFDDNIIYERNGNHKCILPINKYERKEKKS